MKKIIGKTLIAVVGLGILSATSCQRLDDVLDRKPLDQVGPDVFYSTAEQLNSFNMNMYGVFPNYAGSWGAGIATRDNGTDNQAAIDPNRAMFSNDHWKVSATGGLGFNTIRSINWFLSDVTTKDKAGKISGDRNLINQNLGEAKFFRAYLYFDKLRSFGDYPIITEPLPDDEAVLVENAKRMPRNQVARFILKELDEAIALLPAQTNMKQRINKDVARLFKSRVALFEATFELYHKGSGRVPGDANWPGKDKEWNKGKTFDQASEVNFFLDEAMKESKMVADAYPLVASTDKTNPILGGKPNGWNPYYDLFASVNPSGFSEVLLWRQYGKAVQLVHHSSERMRTGTQTGWTRGLVESFLMSDGKPRYASPTLNQGDETISKLKDNSDLRLQLFIFADGDLQNLDGVNPIFQFASLIEKPEIRESTGYRQRKGYNYDPDMVGTGQKDETALILFRSAEAYLNYIEASYLRKNTLDADAKKYWTELRRRAGITAEIEVTINATDMGTEAKLDRPSYDWAAFSAGKPIDATLYSIRRERRSEFAGEGFRMDDLIRWRAMDQVRNYQIEGMNFWTSAYKDPSFSGVIADGGAQSVLSSKDLGVYLRPYQKIKANNDMYDGYTFWQAHYLSPFSVEELRLCSPTKDENNSNLYQNPGWPTVGDGKALH